MSDTHDPVTLDVLEANIHLLAEKERLEHDKRRLQEIDRLKTEFLARVSHDLRTPLNSILGFSDLLMAGVGGKLGKKHNEFVAAIHRNGQALLALINDLLDLSSIESGQLTLRRDKLPLTTLLDDLQAATAPLLAAGRLEVRWPDRNQLIGKDACLDRRRIAQALNNLVDNARKFTPEGGVISVEMDADAHEAVFTISDSGPGIPEHEHEKIFRPFYQRSSPSLQRASGVGLGLAIVRGIVDLHGGTIALTSAAGKGCAFRLHLPQG